MKNGFSGITHLPVYLLMAAAALLNMLWIKPLFKSIDFLATLPHLCFSFIVCLSGIISVFIEFYVLTGLLLLANLVFCSLKKNPN